VASMRHRVRADGKASWQVLYRYGDKQRSETFWTEREARDFRSWCDDLGVEQALEILAAREGKSGSAPLLPEWCERYIEQLTGVSEGTRARYRAHVANDLGMLAKLPVDAISHESIAHWVNAQAATGLSGKTIANRHGFLSGALRQAVRQKIIDSNPCEGTRLPKTERREMTFLTPVEMAQLLEYVRPDAQGLVLTLAATGLRWGEATALQVRDVDLEYRTVTVSRAWKWTGRNTEMKLGAPKTKKSLRTISIPPQVAAILHDASAGKSPTDLLFTNPKGDPWREPAFHSAVWGPAVARANGQQPRRHNRRPAPVRMKKDGTPARVRTSTAKIARPGDLLGKRPRIHDLRHTCASWMVREGTPLMVVQYHLGHESITTTIDRYSHLEPAQMRAAAGALEAALNITLPQIEP